VDSVGVDSEGVGSEDVVEGGRGWEQPGAKDDDAVGWIGQARSQREPTRETPGGPQAWGRRKLHSDGAKREEEHGTLRWRQLSG
jgi:hypothetical protein